MAESAVAESIAPVADSAASTPVSEAPQEQEQVQSPVVESPVAGTETPGGEEKPTEGEAPKPLDQWSLDELNAKAYKDGLTAEETRRRDALQQADTDRRIQEQRTVAEMRERERQRREEVGKAEERFAQGLEQLEQLQAEHGGAPELYSATRRQLVQRLRGELEQLALEPHVNGLRDALLRLQGDNVQNRQAVSARNLPELVNDLYSFAYEAGRKAGAPEGYEMKKASDWKAETDKAVKAALDEYKAKNPGAGLPSTGGVASLVPTGKHPRDMSDAEYASWHDSTTEAERARAWAQS